MFNSKILKNASIYTVVSFLQKGIGFFLLPVYTSYLTTEQFGIVGVVNAITAFLNILFLLALHGGLNRFYHEKPKDEIYLKKLFGTVFTLVLINSLILTGLLVISKDVLLEPLAKGISFYPYLLLGLISSLLNPIFVISQTSLQASQKGSQFGKNNLLFFLSNIILTIAFLVSFNMKAEGILLASVLTNIIFFIYTLYWFLPQIKLGIDREILKKIIKYSFPLIPHSVSGMIMGMVDRIFINNYLSTSLVGVYNVAFQFGNIINIVAIAVNQALIPWFVIRIDKGEKAKIVNISTLFIDAYCLMTLFISLFSVDIIKVLTTSEYHNSWEVVTPIVFAFYFQGIYYFYVQSLFYDVKAKGTRILPIVTVSAAIINVIGNYFLIPKYGLMGAAFSSLLARFITLCLIIPIANKLLPIGYNLRRIIYITIICLIIASLQYINLGFEFSLIFRILSFSMVSGFFIFSNIKNIKGYL